MEINGISIKNVCKIFNKVNKQNQMVKLQRNIWPATYFFAWKQLSKIHKTEPYS